MANKANNGYQRAAIHAAIWAIADDLRGAVDGWDFKNYVLGTMFYRYLSENLADYINKYEHEEVGNTNFDYARLSDTKAEEARADIVNSKGFFILPSELFCNVCARAKNDENLNETLEKVFAHIEDSSKGSEYEDRFAGLFADFDTNSNKLGGTVTKRNERIFKILEGVAKMDFGVTEYRGDAFGDAYEYLMAMYASSAGKSGGEFFTPADVSELLTRLGTVAKKTINKVYDPACGSGSLLLKAIKILGSENKVERGFYGQEINHTTYNLCRINMFLHGISPDRFSIECGDTLTDPKHWDDEPFELIVSNPPYSIKWGGE